MIKESFEDFIGKAIGKLDATTVILMLPCMLLLYICFFIPNEDIEKLFGIEQHETIKKEIECPHCKKHFIYYLDVSDTTNLQQPHN